MAYFSSTSIASLLAALFLLTGCETSFDVFGESDTYFSLHGFLDASADTQWVRIEALQDSLLINTRPLDAVVTLTHLATGRTSTWHDSLFQYVEGATAYNYWSADPILPLETYRLQVERSDGASSAVTITLPDAFPDPFINFPPFSIINLPVSGNVCAREFDMIIRTERLAALQFTYHVPTLRPNVTRRHSVSYIPLAERVDTNLYEVTVSWVDDLLELATLDPDIRLNQLLQLEAVDLLVAAAGPNWPDNALSDETVALPGTITHIEQGFGFVGGVVSKRLSIPLGDYRDVSCFD